MREKITIPPPSQFQSFSPSQLFRFFFRVGRWTEESFSSEFQTYTRGTLISVVTINKWKNHDVIPTRYSGQLFKLIETIFAEKVANDWIAAFEIVWAGHSARPAKRMEKSHAVVSSDIICKQHAHWIQSLYEDNLFGETVAPTDIYVPIQLIECHEDDLILYSHEDLIDRFTSPSDPEAKPNWTFISGEPGSGKSMLAIHLAHSMSKTDVMPIYLRGSHISDIDIDICDENQPVIDSFSVKSFLSHFRSSSNQVACLFLDGIQEISDGSTTQTSSQFFKTLRLEQNICRAHGKTLRIIALDHPADIDAAYLSMGSPHSKRLNLIGLDGSLKRDNGTIQTEVGPDMRSLWWKKYLLANGIPPDPILPDFLSVSYDDFSEFSSNPFSIFLMCQTILRQEKDPKTLAYESVNTFTYSENKNKFYEAFLNTIYMRAASKNLEAMDKSRFISTLQYFALSRWHHRQNNEENVRKIIDDKPASKPASTSSIVARTFYDQSSVKDQNEHIEFTHDNLSIYLVSKLIIDSFLELILTLADEERFHLALEKWVKVSSHGNHEPSLANYCQKEVEIRFASLPEDKWDFALKVIRNQLNTVHHAGLGLKIIDNIQKSASLLFFIWSCFNLERQKRRGIQYTLSDDLNDFSVRDFKRIQQVSFLDFTPESVLEPQLTTSSFISFSLSALDMTAADLSQLSFSTGHIQSFKCEASSFALTHWCHVKISKSEFNKSTFQQAIFRGCRWIESTLSSCVFQGVKIQKSSFSAGELKNVIFSQCHFEDVDFLSVQYLGVVFDRCIFAHCNFDPSAPRHRIEGINFRHCTFLSMETSLAYIPDDVMDQCIRKTGTEKTKMSQDKNILEAQIREILQ